MKDQYFGDFGDYQKISLLQTLKNEGLSVLAHWLKTSDDGSTDGKYITYFKSPDLWQKYDPDIFEYLKEKVNSSQRSLNHIEQCSFCTGVRFINDNVENTNTRKVALQYITQDEVADVIFFDPDNGIEVASTNKKNVHKYVTWNEITETFNSGKSVIIYQHFSRRNRSVFIQNKLAELQNKLPIAEVVAVQVRHSVYLYAIQKNHKLKLTNALVDFSGRWGDLGIVIRLLSE